MQIACWITNPGSAVILTAGEYLYGLCDLIQPASLAMWQASLSTALDLRLGIEIWHLG